MLEKLKIKIIYKDFVESVRLSKEQTKILDMLLDKETVVKISMEIGVSVRTVSYEIKRIKRLYKDYCDMKLSIALLLME